MENATSPDSQGPAVPAASPRKKKNASLVDLVFIAFGIFVALSTHKTLAFLEARTYDLRLKAAAQLLPVPNESQAVLAPIDDIAVQRYGRWPWSRDRWKPLLDALADIGAASVMFDIEYPEPSEPVLRRSATGQSFHQVIGNDLIEVANQLAPDKLSGSMVRGVSEGLKRVAAALLEAEAPALRALAAKALALPRGKRKEALEAKALPERVLAWVADNPTASKSALGEVADLKDAPAEERLTAASEAEAALFAAAFDLVLAEDPGRADDRVLDAVMKRIGIEASDADYASTRATLANSLLAAARARAVARGKGPATPARLFDHLTEAAGRLAAAIASDLGRQLTRRLDGIKGQLERVVKSPDADLAAAVIAGRLAGMPVYGVLYAAGGLSIEHARKDAYIDEEVRSSLKRPIPDRLMGIHPGRYLEIYPRILRCLTVKPLASPEDPPFGQFQLTAEAVRSSLQSAREHVLGHALDIVLQGRPQLPAAEVHAAVAKIFEMPADKALVDHLEKLLPAARSRAIVVDRFLVRYACELPESIVFRSFTPPIPELAGAFGGLAVSTVTPDVDGVMRRVPLFRQIEDGMLPGLGFLLYLHRVGFTLDKPDEIKNAIRVAPGPVVYLKRPKGGEVEIPLDPAGGLILRMQGTEEQALDRLPITAVIDYVGLKNRLKEVFAQVDTGQDGAWATTILQAAEELMVLRDQPLTFEALTERAKAHGLMQARGAEELLPDVKPEERAGKRAPSDWARLAKAYFERKLKGFEDTLVHRAKKFRKKPPEEQQKKLAEPNSPWAELIKRINAIEELQHMRLELEKRLKGKSVIIGAAQTGNTDSAPTPFASKEPNYALHGHAIATLMGGRFVRRPGHRDATLLPVVMLAMLLGLVLPRVSLSWGALWALFVWFAWGAASVALLAYKGIWVDFVAPSVSVLITYLGLSYWRYKTVEQSKQVYREMFEAYLDKRVIEQFVERPELFREIGGISCEITAFFSDIEGFTTISELCSPEQLSAMLTDYLTPMTDIIQGRGGLRDKYIGDAIVAMWGAPLHAPDHAVQACLASLEQKERLAALKKDERLLADPKSWLAHLRSKGKDFNARMGVNTGLAKVGNFGSARSKNYTMIGDTVNLAARLEGANKAFGTYLMISEFTYAQARDYIEARPLDSIRVKGKLRPVTVYELMAKKNDMSEKMCELREIFVTARNLHLEQRFDEAIAKFREALALKPDDAPSLTLMRRCEHYLETPPAKDWDGTYDLKEK